jgi:hypothetical protein
MDIISRGGRTLIERKSISSTIATLPAARPASRRSAIARRRSTASPLCQLSPAADIRSDEAMSEKCQGTKSLRDSGGMWLIRSVFPTAEIVGNRCCLEDRGIDPQRACCATPKWMIRSVTRRFGTANIMICDPELQNDNYLDAKIERVSARQTETPEVLWDHDPL